MFLIFKFSVYRFSLVPESTDPPCRTLQEYLEPHNGSLWLQTYLNIHLDSKRPFKIPTYPFGLGTHAAGLFMGAASTLMMFS